MTAPAIDRDRLAAACSNGAARARERARFLRRRGEGAAVVEYQIGRAAALEQVAALALAADPGDELARYLELGARPELAGGPPQLPPGMNPLNDESPQGRDDAANGLTPATFAR